MATSCIGIRPLEVTWSVLAVHHSVFVHIPHSIYRITHVCVCVTVCNYAIMPSNATAQTMSIVFFRLSSAHQESWPVSL